MKPNNRENNYDLLRTLSAVAVVFIHINQHYMAYPAPKGFALQLTETVIEVFTRFCVPCFLMISGAFLITDPNNKAYKPFYKKRFIKIVLPYLIVNAVFITYDLIIALIEGGSLWELAKKYLTGYAYNLWFIPVIAGLYLLTPVIIRFKESVCTKAFGIVCGCWIVLAIVLQMTSTYVFAWAFTSVFSYLGYYMLGAFIYENYRNRRMAFLFALLAFCAFSVRVFLRMNKLTWVFRGRNVYFYPTIVIGAIAVFIFFSGISIKTSFRAPATAALYVYLLHTFVFELVLRIFGDKLIVNELLTILIMTAVSFSVSLCIGLLITKRKRIWNKE